MAAPAPLSPLAPKFYAELPPIDGVRLAAGAAGIRYQGRTDVVLAVFDKPAAVAGVFTTSRCPSAPVDWCRDNLEGGTARALVVNSGNANAFTGKVGREATELTAKLAAKAVGADESEIFLASTGVIGEPLDARKFEGVLERLAADARADAWIDAARAIMTTDTFPKVATAKAMIDGVEVTINGIAKGAGMIAPDMATMLAYVFTDAAISSEALQKLLSRGVKDSFNSLTVDSDTSTSDTLMLFATGAAEARGQRKVKKARDEDLEDFAEKLDALLVDLAQQVARDGEGARHFIEVQVTGADSDKAAKRIAFSIANSPLVKTAVAGEDANWGRVVMAVGKAGEKADRDRLSIWFNGIRVAHNGLRDPDYDEAAVTTEMKKDTIVIRADLDIGDGAATVWTCDLTKEYVAINGDYRS
ncbi:glutamate N-acetyltransferase [Rhodoblastus acidophilus]|uniref:Arginine biosynthesis bifunctional protein ArgJ n=1 Tax=Rhodoblastus acidophilus TaxID=1074 RepID=A0A212RPF3_RHOAC|nr:bifunctional glutamate N-acetyltransferase/amino-acid acetyltransferase ArgJ [Rhodoblastus acidophilus]PPQ36736.1 bifunctional ornithine acetyltransferase/N-acetylglutamate synthase [Rhodoblastus acidophilus]RAI21467.1 bifunctional ornithine acetyltransferase/N-acetylglutamate synthase [Rhodoblastus acidophilus]SNB74411.1 glutamate N-acetyltransferase [Rhodoblastus acidophilus]